MSFVTISTNPKSTRRVYARKFDHDEALVRWKAGESVAALAHEYGVSNVAVYRVVNPKLRRKMAASTKRRIELSRVPCRGGCGVLVWMHTKRESGYCRTCSDERRRVVRHGTETEYGKRGCRCEPCRLAANAARRERRHRTRQPCTKCGTPVATQGRRDPTKPLECNPCALKRNRRAEKRAA